MSFVKTLAEFPVFEARTTSDAKDQPNNIKISSLEQFARNTPAAGDHRVQGSLLIYVEEGQAKARLGQQEIFLNSAQVLILCGKYTDHLSLGTGCKGYVIFTGESSLHELQLMQGTEMEPFTAWHTVINVDELFRQEVQAIATKMWSMALHQPDNGKAIVSSLFRVFLFYLSISIKQCTDHVAVTRASDITNRFFNLVNTAPTMQKRVVEYARELQVSANYLSRIVKRNAGVSPISYVHQRFIVSAKKLALETPLSMKEIAYRLGFEDTSHFSRFFKVNTGLNFSEFRKMAIPEALSPQP